MNQDGWNRSRSSSQGPRVPWVWFILLTSVLYLPLHSTPDFDDINYELADVYSRHEQSSGARKLAFALLGVGGFISLAIGGFRNLEWRGLIGLLLFVNFYWAGASLLWSGALHAGVRRLLVLVMFSIGALAVAARWPQRLIILFIVFASAAHVSMNLVIEIAHGQFTPIEPGYRFKGTLDPNTLGITCVFLVLAALVAARPPSHHPIFFKAVALCGFVLLLLTRSRTSVAGLVAALTVYWHLVVPAKKRWAAIFLFVMFIMVLLMVFGEIFLGLLPEVALLGREADRARTLTGRIPLWVECLKYINQRPLVGYGFNSFWTPERTYDISRGAGWVATRAHSAYFELMLTGGVVGLSIYLAFLAAVFWRAVNCFARTRAPEFALAAATVVVYIVVGILETFIMMTSYSSVAFYSAAVVLHLSFRADVSQGAKPELAGCGMYDGGLQTSQHNYRE